jgi:cell division protein FtsL
VSYSFTKSNPKPLFAEDTKLWLMFIGAISVLMIFFSLFLVIKATFLKKDIASIKTQIEHNSIKIADLTKKVKFIQKEKTLYTKIVVNNELLKDGVKNLLDLIPDPITLTNIKIEKNSLYLYGITPSKEVYNILLLPPLKSIFTQTDTNFYQMSNGWYRFESINRIKEEK